MKTETTAPNINPGAIATPSVSSGSAFLISTAEWNAIQTYVTHVPLKYSKANLKLPTTEEEFDVYMECKKLVHYKRDVWGKPIEFGKRLKDYTKVIDINKSLLKIYNKISANANDWRDNIYPNIHTLATDTSEYAKNAPSKFIEILPLIQKLINDPCDEGTRLKLDEKLEELKKNVKDYHDRAQEVLANIRLFADKTKEGKEDLTGTGSAGMVGGIFREYQNQFFLSSGLLVEKEGHDERVYRQGFVREYSNFRFERKKSLKEAWEATVLTSIDVKKIKELENTIVRYYGEFDVIARVMCVINNAQEGLCVYIKYIGEALPVIHKIQGAWEAIFKELSNIDDLIQTNIQEALPVNMNLGVYAATEAWLAIGNKVDEFLTYALETDKV